MLAEGALGPARFVRWWLGELRACIPGPVARALFGSDSRIVATLTAGDVALAVLRQGKLKDLARLPTGDRRALRTAAQRLLARNRLGNAPVTLCMPAGQVLRPRIEVPVEAAENLRDVVAIDMDRHTPFAAGEVLFDLRVTGSDAERQRLRVDLVVARKSDADKALATARDMGLAPDTLTFADDARQGRRFNLLPPDRRPRRSRVLAYANGVLALACCGLAAVAVWQAIDRTERTVAAFDARLAELRASTGEADRQGERLGRLIALSGRLIDEKSARAPVVSIIDEIAARTPYGSWLIGYTYRGDTIELIGFSEDPLNLLRQLEDSEMFSDVRFAAPLTMDPRVGRERFNIRMTLAAAEPPQ